MALEGSSNSKNSMTWSQEVQLNGPGSSTLPDDYYSLQADHKNVFYDYEDQGIENIQLKMRSTVFLEPLQAPEYKTHQGIEYIQSKIRSTVFTEALQSPGYENQDIEYIETRIKSTVFDQVLQYGYENQQGIENIQKAMRSTKSLEALQAPKYANQQGIEDIYAKIRSTNIFEALEAPEYENNEESKQIQADEISTEHDTQPETKYIHGKERSIKQEAKFENQEEMEKQRDKDQISFLHDMLEVVEFEQQHWIDNIFGKEIPTTRPKLHSFAQQRGFYSIQTVLQEEIDKLQYKVKKRHTPFPAENKALALRLIDAIYKFGNTVFREHRNQSGDSR